MPDNPCGLMTTSVFGTKGYIDPVALATGNFRAASDVFSLGVTMRELLTGSRVPWIGIPGPPEFRSLILSMTDSDVDKRPTAREIFEQVQMILQTAPVPIIQELDREGLGWLLAGAAVVVGACLYADGD